MTINCIHFSSIINLTVSDDVRCCVYTCISPFGYLPIQNAKRKFTLYFAPLLSSVPWYNLGRPRVQQHAVPRITLPSAI